jgi:putative transposase
VKSECLDHFIVFGEGHLRHLIDQYLIYYHTCRPHQGKDNVPLVGIVTNEASPLRSEDVVCEERLGGLLKHFRRRAG